MTFYSLSVQCEKLQKNFEYYGAIFIYLETFSSLVSLYIFKSAFSSMQFFRTYWYVSGVTNLLLGIRNVHLKGPKLITNTWI